MSRFHEALQKSEQGRRAAAAPSVVNSTTVADADSFDVRASFRSISEAIRHQKMLVLLTCVVTLAGVALYVYIWPPIYNAEVTVMAEPDYDYQRDSFYTGWDVFRKDEARTEVELMTAGPVLLEVAKREKLTYDDVYHPFLSQVSYFWEKSWVGRHYRAIKKKLFPPEDKDAPSQEDLELGRIVGDLSAGVVVEPVADSNVGKLRVKGPSRRVSSIANTVMDVYLAQRSERHHKEAQQSLKVLQEQVTEAAKAVKEVADRRTVFSQKNMLAFDFQKESLEVTKLTELEANIATSKQKMASLQASLGEVEKQLAKEPPVKTTSTVYEINSVRESAKLKRMDIQTALIQARDHYREDSPEIKEMLGDLAKLDALIAESSEKVEKVTTEGLNSLEQQLMANRNSMRVELLGIQAGLNVTEVTAARIRERLAVVPTMQNTLNAMDRDLAAASDKYKQMLVKEGQASMSVATSRATMPSIRVVEYAVPPGDKSWPKVKYLYPIALLTGLLLGLFAAVIRTYTSGRILREHVERGRGNAPLYGTIAVAAQGRSVVVTSRAKKELARSAAAGN